jgi:hypothetical protein
MSATMQPTFETYLESHTPDQWARAIDELSPDIHEVDRDATRIWFAFHPLTLLRALQDSDEPARLAHKLQLQGAFLLTDEIDTSHRFLYGHRFWAHVKRVCIERNDGGASPSAPLASVIREAAAKVAAHAGADVSLTLGITAVGFMTMVQVDFDAFKATPGTPSAPAGLLATSPDEILRERARTDSQGLLGFLRSTNKQFTVTFDETRDGRTYKVVNNQDLAMASALVKDREPWQSSDPRCCEGPIPVECRTAACGTCWVGVLGGADRLAPVDVRERQKLREFGYADSEESHPVIRLACTAKAFGNVSVVIPAWNGFYGIYLAKRAAGKKDGEL